MALKCKKKHLYRVLDEPTGCFKKSLIMYRKAKNSSRSGEKHQKDGILPLKNRDYSLPSFNTLITRTKN